MGLIITCAILGLVADADLLFGAHRTYSHSIAAVLVAGLAAAVVAARTNRSVIRIGLTCAAAYATHLLLDWMAVDRVEPAGIQALWPLSRTWYISGWDVFRQTERRAFLSLPSVVVNLQAVAQEVAILAPILVGLWLVGAKILTRLPVRVPDADSTAEIPSTM